MRGNLKNKKITEVWVGNIGSDVWADDVCETLFSISLFQFSSVHSSVISSGIKINNYAKNYYTKKKRLP
jgi:hypothetical protein